MSRNKYESELTAAEAALDGLLNDLDFLQMKIARKKREIAALRELAQVADDADAPSGLVEGITDAVRTVLRASGAPMLPMEVRDQVQSLGIQQDNLLASIHTVLKRLVKAKEAREAYIKSGGENETPVRYQWMTAFLRHAIRGLDLPKVEVPRTREGGKKK